MLMYQYGIDTSTISLLRYWCQTVLPAVYDDSLSYYELLAKVVDKLNEGLSATGKWATYIAENAEAIKELQDLFKKFQESGFNDYYAKQVAEWINNNLSYIYDHTIKQIYFGLTDDGYFCAYVPDSWSDIEFDTGAMYGRSDYGRLILRYDVTNGQGVIDNTYHYSLANAKDNDVINTLVKDVEHIGKTLWTAMSQPVEGGE